MSSYPDQTQKSIDDIENSFERPAHLAQFAQALAPNATTTTPPSTPESSSFAPAAGAAETRNSAGDGTTTTTPVAEAEEDEGGVQSLVKNYLNSINVGAVLDDVVSVKEDCEERYRWLRKYVGLISKVSDAAQLAVEQGLELDATQAQLQQISFAVVEFNLLNADFSFDAITDDDEDDDDDDNNKSNNNKSNTNKKKKLHAIDRIGMPSSVVHVAIPVDQLEVRDRGISALDTVIHKPSSSLGSVGGFCLRVSVMPVEFPEKVARMMKAASASSSASNNNDNNNDEDDDDDESDKNKKKPLGRDEDYFDVPPRLHPLLGRNVRDLHCTDLMPANPYRRTVAVVHHETLRVGFVDAVNQAAVILLDNGSVAICSRAHEVEDKLLARVSGSPHSRRKHRSKDSVDKAVTSDILRAMVDEAAEQRAAETGGGVATATAAASGNNKWQDEVDADTDDDDEEEEEDDLDEEENDEDEDEGTADSLDAILERNNPAGEDDDFAYDESNMVDEESKDSEIIQTAMMIKIRERNRAAVAAGSATVEEQRQRLEDAVQMATQMFPHMATSFQESLASPGHLASIGLGTAGSAAADAAGGGGGDEDLEHFDDYLGPQSDAALPNWAYSRPTLGWFRRVRVPHKLVKKGRIVMVMGQPDYDGEADDDDDDEGHYNKKNSSSKKKKKKKTFDEGTVICMSPESIAVRWCVPHFDVNAEPPISELDPEVDVRELFVVQHFYSELMGVDSQQDVAFVRPGTAERRKLWADAQQRYAELEKEREEEIRAAEKSWRDSSSGAGIEKSASATAGEPLPTAEPPLLYNVQEVETATGEMNCVELNKFYQQFVFPQPIEDAVAELSYMDGASSNAAGHRFGGRGGRAARLAAAKKKQQAAAAGGGSTLLHLEPWRNYFSNLSEQLKRAVRIVDAESFHCVTLINGEKKFDVPSYEMVRPDDSQQAASPLDHITAFPRDIVTRAADHFSADAVQQQQLAQDAQSTALPKVTLMMGSSPPTSPNQSTATAASSSVSQNNNNSSEKKKNRRSRLRFNKLEDCALFDLQRSAHPDADCVVSDIVTLRTRDDQAQIISLSGPAPKDMGVVRSVNPSQMTAQVAWGTWESNDNEDEQQAPQDGASALLAAVESYPNPFSLARARVAVDPDDKFAASFDTSSSPFRAGCEDFMVGQVMGKVSLNEVVVQWWNGAVERIAPSRLVVHHFPYEEAEDEEDEEYEEDEEGDDETVPIEPSSNPAAALLNSLGFAPRVDDGSNPFVDDEDHRDDQEQPAAAAAAATSSPIVFAGGRSNMPRIPSDVERGEPAAVEKFLNEVHTPNSPSPPSTPSNPMNDGGAADQQQQQQPQGSLVGSVLASAGRSVGSFLSSMFAPASTPTSPTATTDSSTQQQPQQQQQPQKQQRYQDPLAGVAADNDAKNKKEEQHQAGAAAAAAAASSAPPTSPPTSASSPVTLSSPAAAAVGSGSIPANSVPGTYVSCSRFSAHLADDSTTTFTPVQPAVFAKRVMNELKHLRNTAAHVADIFVKSNEDRIHSLKFAIAGGVHTPYYQGFYCFDLALPPGFPNAPPLVRFHSRNMRLNPNLYEDGLVCLSLLGTWTGQNMGESWSVTSTIRQVMLSIQALILCQEPFFNEPGDEALNGTRDGATHSRMFNEKIFLMKIGHLMHQAQQHPADWYGEFREHYLRVVPRMLIRFKKYLELAAAADKKPQQQQQQQQVDLPPPGSVNADGLILPLSAGLRTALANRVEQLQAQYTMLSGKWKEEMESFSAGFGEDDDDDE